jgi:hypothetical protein
VFMLIHLLAVCAVPIWAVLPTFRRYTLPRSSESTMKAEAACTSGPSAALPTSPRFKQQRSELTSTVTHHESLDIVVCRLILAETNVKQFSNQRTFMSRLCCLDSCNAASS